MSELPDDIYCPEMQQSNTGGSVLIVTADDTEDLEFFYPYYRFIEAGYKVDVVTPKGGQFKAKHGLGLKQTLKMTDVDAGGYDLLYVPGGKAPAQLKEEKSAVELVKKFAATGKPIASICHGPQLLAKADVIKGRKIAAWPECEAEIKEAGAAYINQETVVDGPFITARWPADLPAHLRQIFQSLAKMGKQNGKMHIAA